MKRGQVAVEVFVRVGEVDVSGRKYRVPHIIMYGQSEALIELKPYDISISAVFDGLPYVRCTQSELIILKSENDIELLEHSHNIIRFDIDDKVLAKIDDRVYSFKRVKVYTRRPVIVNAMILWPLMVSILSIGRVEEMNIKVKEDMMVVEI